MSAPRRWRPAITSSTRTDASTTSRSSSGVCGRAVGADEFGDVDVNVDAALLDLVNQPRALDLVEAQAAPQRLDRPSILGDAASAGVGRKRGIDFRGYVAEVKRGHDRMLANWVQIC